MRASFLALTAVLLGLAVVPSPSGPAAASCAAPTVAIDGHAGEEGRVTLVPGQEVTVTGRGFVDGCDDGGAMPVTPSCSGDDDGDYEPKPLTDIELVAIQRDANPEQTSLAVADAGTAEDDELGQVTWTFVVPRNLSPGPAVLKTVGSEPLPVRIAPVVIVD